MRKSERPAPEGSDREAPARYEVAIDAVGYVLRGERLCVGADVDFERLMALGAIRPAETPLDGGK